MANFVLSPDFIDYTILGASSENALWPASNLKLYQKQFSWWRTTVTTDSYVDVDLLVATPVTGVALINANFTSYYLKFDTTTAFTSPPVNAGPFTIQKDEDRKRYYSYKNPQTFSPAVNHRYMRLFIPMQSTTDGDSGFSLGALVILSGTTEMIIGPVQNLGVTISRASRKLDGLGGGREVTDIGERRATIRLSVSNDVRVEAQADEISKKFLAIDETTPVLITDNGNFLSKLTNSPFVYVATREGDAAKNYHDYSNVDTGEITFREEI